MMKLQHTHFFIHHFYEKFLSCLFSCGNLFSNFALLPPFSSDHLMVFVTVKTRLVFQAGFCKFLCLPSYHSHFYKQTKQGRLIPGSNDQTHGSNVFVHQRSSMWLRWKQKQIFTSLQRIQELLLSQTNLNSACTPSPQAYLMFCVWWNLM